ncbi:MAG TPA: DinB family protein, partial [Blastocatellia bacterium]|nr:DinB family protein [Blastocatellia bacterium]
MLEITISALSSFPDQLERLFQVVPESHLHWTPASWEGIPSETLTVIEQICHVRDIEIEGYQVRFRRLLEESNPALVS